MTPPTTAAQGTRGPHPRTGRIHQRRDRPGRPRCCRRRARGQRPSRDRRTARMTSGIGSPVAVLRHTAGNDGAATGTGARNPDSSIRCCGPTRRERRRPERIHRRTVSALQPARRAASGTVSMRVAYYNMLRCGGFSENGSARTRGGTTGARRGRSTSTPTCRRATPPSSSRSRIARCSRRWACTGRRAARTTTATRR